MKVAFTQSGGFAGLVKGCELDTASLAPELVADLERLVRASGLSGAGSFLSPGARDALQYEIAIDDGGQRVAVSYDDTTLPAAAKPLVGLLKKHARPMKP
ncbi:MAG: hypothetical protein HY289_03960 [Planctomycetes bacterium]|nr:hypothetical protein [Planctomycetota bacterium]